MGCEAGSGSNLKDLEALGHVAQETTKGVDGGLLHGSLGSLVEAVVDTAALVGVLAHDTRIEVEGLLGVVLNADVLDELDAGLERLGLTEDEVLDLVVRGLDVLVGGGGSEDASSVDNRVLVPHDALVLNVLLIAIFGELMVGGTEDGGDPNSLELVHDRLCEDVAVGAGAEEVGPGHLKQLLKRLDEGEEGGVDGVGAVEHVKGDDFDPVLLGQELGDLGAHASDALKKNLLGLGGEDAADDAVGSGNGNLVVEERRDGVDLFGVATLICD
mmetsp:Transcript_18685/g.38208  ORF Transcript_18685/g.38208 Transcript_18685/m.38208 type:complete len:272 (-) Transcript_18685:461-1276(-)